MSELKSVTVWRPDGFAYETLEIGKDGVSSLRLFDGGGGEASSIVYTRQGETGVFYGMPYEAVMKEGEE
jgi:hypothetical protein